MKIEVKNLVRHFGKNRAVDNISFDFMAGHIFGFIGPNGAGKTTTIKIMSTLDLPDNGDVFFNGVSVVDSPEEIRRLLGYMPDTLPMHNDIMVWEYLDFFARAYGFKGTTRTRILKDIEEFTGLGNIRTKYLKALSKGMKQRVSLARALVHDPKVLVLDEPAAGLDPRARMELRGLLRVLAEQGKAILISSHILSELQDICHGAVIIEKGRILGAGKIDEISKHSTRETTTVLIRFVEKDPGLLKQILQLPQIANARESAEYIVAEVKGQDTECANLLSEIVRLDLKVTEFKHQVIGLEDLFMKVTKGEIQ